MHQALQSCVVPFLPPAHLNTGMNQLPRTRTGAVDSHCGCRAVQHLWLHALSSQLHSARQEAPEHDVPNNGGPGWGAAYGGGRQRRLQNPLNRHPIAPKVSLFITDTAMVLNC